MKTTELNGEDWLTKNCELKDWANLEESLNDFINTTDVIRYMEAYADYKANHILEAYAEAEQDKWVDIETTMPPVCTPVLGYGEKSGINIRYFSKGYETLNNDEFEKLSGITAWQSLPKSPISK